MQCVSLLQTIEENAKQRGLTRLIRENDFANTVVKRLMALPLLPELLIAESLDSIRLYAEVRIPGEREVFALIDYVQRFWLGR